MSERLPRREEIGPTLLEIARSTLEHAFDHRPPAERLEAWLREQGACFVTLNKGGELRGCIGSAVAYRPLLEDLRENTMAAAFRDPRFPPLRREELEETSLEVSLLEPLEAVTFQDEKDLVRQLRPHADGVVLECGARRGLFLPTVWSSLPEPEEFLRKLKRKAGLAEDFWSQDVRVWRFTVSSWKERG
ncbi:MAG: AmmeMemoRadiSam system protein A [Thermoanaerobaculia bacterium]